jgi:four helix bundle protein
MCGSVPVNPLLAKRRTVWTQFSGSASGSFSSSKHRGGLRQEGESEFRRYLNISLGSLSELSYTLWLAKDLEILSEQDWRSLDQLHQKAGGMTWLLYKSLLSSKETTR